MPKVSVIIPAYNAGQYVGAAVTSVLAQSMRDLTLIVIDDGSNDDTLCEIERAAKGDARVQIISRPNKGIVATPNEGIDRADSPWVAMLDADDVSRPDRLQKQLELADARRLTLVGSQIEHVGERSGVSDFPTSHADIVHQLFVWKNPIANPSVLIDRNWLGDMRYPSDCAHAQDYALWLRLALRRDACFGVHPEALVQYRIHAQQNTTRNLSQLYEGCERALTSVVREMGLFDPTTVECHTKAFRALPIDNVDEFRNYSWWLATLYAELKRRSGDSRAVYEFWRRLFQKSAKTHRYDMKTAFRLGAGPLQNVRYGFKYGVGRR
ncbi:glycosyltransferase family 2 protein [Litorivivens sp.]|uniref:glycosyltransferase family 2 protein n=1 Tax=Litorivivens sp. TaxID=2020868 RepID=UPI00356921CF